MLTISGREFLMDGKKFNIYSGAMHYFRSLPEYWEDRMLKMKAAGLNTVETYVAWNVHEPKEGEYCFDGRYDIARFIETATKVGLYVIIRPGPYICAEWDFGGFPSWLLKYEDIRLRCYEEKYLSYVTKYFKKLLSIITPYQMTNGGNVIAMQVENEYGSYGDDKKYLAYLRDLMKECGVNVMLFTSDGEGKYHLSGGSLSDEFKVVNFGSYPNEGFHDVKEYQPDKPLMCGEYWCGWFDHYGNTHPKAWNTGTKRGMEEFFSNDANFNFYMFYGGTNFGFSSGANYHDRYYPTTTSYDYNAPLNEYGDYTPKYHIIRECLLNKQNLSKGELPPRPTMQALGEVKLDKTAYFLDNIKLLGEKYIDHIPHYMEHYGQANGYILYHTEIHGDYPDTSIGATGVHDIAYVYVDGKLIGRYDRTEKNDKGLYPETFDFKIPAFKGTISVDILVEGMGRINFAKKIYDRKGLATVMIGEQMHFGFEIYTLPIDNIDKLTFHDIATAPVGKNEYPKFISGKFNADSQADCFVDMQGFTKGCVFINGFNLGRYWNIGPQRTLYVPGVILKDENEIVILEQEKTSVNCINILDKPIFGKFLGKVKLIDKIKSKLKK